MPKPICPDCKSKEVRYKKTTNSYWCRVCGKEWPKPTKRNKAHVID